MKSAAIDCGYVNHGYSVTFASTLFSAYFVVHGITQPAIGRLSDRYGREVTAGLCALTGIAGYSLLILGSQLVVHLLGIVLVGVGMGWGAALLPRFMDNLSAAEQGAGFGFARTAYMIVSSVGSAVVGSLADLAGWGVAFGLFVALLIVNCFALASNRAFDLDL